ncbi:nitroreductase family protein [Methanobacterium sp.]|jgi:nitroreductase/NAD-dependent dihydropyrimidine dehydrogenase PreA subunit|uniref:nitroreductase family protein n=1 Tax=Methanobacterium sp. TaxID=2164 RepID=UPI003158472C
MSEFNLNRSACSSCGTCVSACTSGRLKMNTNPEVIADMRCIECGHCEAMCPEGAINISGPELEAPMVDISSKISPEDMGNYMRNRRSIRNYKKRPIPRETIEEIMDVVRFAPSGGNQQPVEWIIIEDPQKVKELAGLVIKWMEKLVEENSPFVQILPVESLISVWKSGLDPILRGAPNLFVATAKSGEGSTPMDGIIALSYLDLLLPSFGLGSCWAGFLQMAADFELIREFLGLKDGEVFLGALMAGYPECKFFRVPKRKKLSVMYI